MGDSAPMVGVGSGGGQRTLTLFPRSERGGNQLVPLYRPHARDTYARWAAGVPENFRFSVKVPKAITHEAKLLDPGPALQQFLDQADGLGPKLGVLLVQLPGRFGFDARVAEAFFAKLRKMHTGMVVCEPRNPTWFSSEANAVLDPHGIGRVAADPPRGTTPVAPGGWDGIAYFRLHGSPRIYSSAYDQPFLWAIARRVTALPVPTWVIFDNTGSGSAFENATRMRDLLAIPATPKHE